ncbi:hypothetical protein D3C81_2041660 [compost metagenome]
MERPPSSPIFRRSSRWFGSLIKSPEVLKELVEGRIDVFAPPRELFQQFGVIVGYVLEEVRLVEHEIRYGGIE